jgi:hypothetical protein
LEHEQIYWKIFNFSDLFLIEKERDTYDKYF